MSGPIPTQLSACCGNANAQIRLWCDNGLDLSKFRLKKKKRKEKRSCFGFYWFCRFEFICTVFFFNSFISTCVYIPCFHIRLANKKISWSGNNRLTGTIPSDLADLDYLFQYIDLSKFSKKIVCTSCKFTIFSLDLSLFVCTYAHFGNPF